jgi:UPF0716 protein FxsA
MFFRLFLLFTLVPLVEIFLLAWIAEQTNWLVTLLLILLPGLLGAWLARREGLRCLRVVREEMARGQMPAASLLDGLMILVAGALLVTPGVLTDLAGFALLIPPVRRLVRRVLTRRIHARIVRVMSASRTAGPGHDEIVDVRVIDAESRPPQKPRGT